MDTVSTPASSSTDHVDMSIIMRDYGHIDHGQPIIGKQNSFKAFDYICNTFLLITKRKVLSCYNNHIVRRFARC